MDRQRPWLGRRLVPIAFMLAASIAAAACGGSTSETNAEWYLASTRGSTVVIKVLVGDSCSRLQSVTSDESGDAVELRATVVRDTGEPCREVAQIVAYEAHLLSPLGGRTLTGCRHPDDAPCDTALPG